MVSNSTVILVPHGKKRRGVERNHELIRYILPKGSSFDLLNQNQVYKIMNHINSYTRDKAPINIFQCIHSNVLVQKIFHLEKTAPNLVTLNKSLLK